MKSIRLSLIPSTTPISGDHAYRWVFVKYRATLPSLQETVPLGSQLLGEAPWESTSHQIGASYCDWWMISFKVPRTGVPSLTIPRWMPTASNTIMSTQCRPDTVLSRSSHFCRNLSLASLPPLQDIGCASPFPQHNLGRSIKQLVHLLPSKSTSPDFNKNSAALPYSFNTLTSADQQNNSPPFHQFFHSHTSNWFLKKHHCLQTTILQQLQQLLHKILILQLWVEEGCWDFNSSLLWSYFFFCFFLSLLVLNWLVFIK